MFRRLLTPWRAARALREQVGDVRASWLAGDRVDRRDDYTQHDQIVLLLHGTWQTRNIWEVMEDRLRFDGYGVLSFNLGGWIYRYGTRPVDEIARTVASKVEALAERRHFDKIHVVGHSQGGWVARRWIEAFGGARRARCLVTLGTAHHHMPLALLQRASGRLNPTREGRGRDEAGIAGRFFPPEVPITSIYSRDDYVRPWWASVLHAPTDGEDVCNIEVRGIGHSALVWDPGVYLHVRARLERATARGERP